MSAKAKAIQTLYKSKQITLWGVRQSVYNNIITKEEFKKITGVEF